MKNLKYLMVSYYYLEVSYSVSNIQDYFEYVIKKHETLTDKSLIQIFINKIQNRITFKIKTGYYFEYLTPDTIKLLGGTERSITKDKYGENVPRL